MIAALMTYCFSIAALIGLAAFAIERAVASIGWPRRAVWIAALLGSLCLPLSMMVIGNPDAAPRPVAFVDVPTTIDIASIAEASTFSLPTVNTVLKRVWLLASSGLLFFVLFGWVRLRYAARLWTIQTIDGVAVRIADDLGPAVVGFLKPQIVVPRWLLDARPADRSAVVAHERSHILAGDTLLLLLALLLVLAMPWNLPMWWQLRRLRFAVEVDCDRRVLRGGASVATYGEMLLAVGQRNSRIPIGAIALTEPASQLERRIRIMTSGKNRNVTLMIFASMTMSASLVTVAAQLSAPPLSTIAPNLFSSSTATRETPQPTGIAERASVAAIEQPRSTSHPDAGSLDRAVPIKPANVNATKLAAVNPAIGKLELASGGQASKYVDINPKRIYSVMPVYPDAALRSGIYDGLVDLAFTVAVTGDVQNAAVIKSAPAGAFEEAALTAIRQWRYEPAIKDGQAVATQLKMRMKFHPGPYSIYPKTEAQPGAVATSEQASTNVSGYSGERLNLKFTEIDVREVLKVIADASGQNILISDKVTGSISLQLSNTPWDQALDYIVVAKGLVKRQQGGIIFIEPGTAQIQH